jgi:hypothetical protein
MNTQFESGNVVSYRGQGMYEIIEKQENSRTLFTIKDIDRGAGWDENKKSYVGVNTTKGWHRGQNHDYGLVIADVHKKDFELISKEV